MLLHATAHRTRGWNDAAGSRARLRGTSDCRTGAQVRARFYSFLRAHVVCYKSHLQAQHTAWHGVPNVDWGLGKAMMRRNFGGRGPVRRWGGLRTRRTSWGPLHACKFKNVAELRFPFIFIEDRRSLSCRSVPSMQECRNVNKSPELFLLE